MSAFHSSGDISFRQADTRACSASSSAREASPAFFMTIGVIRRANAMRSLARAAPALHDRIEELAALGEDRPRPIELFGLQAPGGERGLGVLHQAADLAQFGEDGLVQRGLARMRGEHHVQRQRDVRDRLEDVVDGRGVGRLLPRVAPPEDHIVALDEDHRSSVGEGRFLGALVGRRGRRR